MEVIIHGTKGGYNTLFKTSKAPLLDIDIRNNTSSEAAIGGYAYSIAFVANGSVYTKYIIIRDSLRSHATGTIAFSLVLSKGKELVEKGKDVLSILDELSSHYLSEYVKNNNINKDESSHVFEEDWSFVIKILNKHKEQDRNRTDIEIKPGKKEAAFIFYKNDIELQDYFSKPFQKEYDGYKQILFISKELESLSVELLNVLNNSGVELKNIDLGNEYFYLNNYIPSKGIAIYVNGESLSKTNNAFRANDELTLKFVKDDRYYFPIPDIKGTITDSNSEIRKYLKKTSNQIIIDYNELSEQKQRIKNITFKTINWNGKSVNADIFCSNSENKKPITDNKGNFKGEEIGQEWKFYAKKSDDLYSDEVSFTPAEKSQIELTLNEYKSVKFFAVDSETGNNINGFKVKVNEKPSKDTIKFKNDNIQKRHKITIQCQGYENYTDTYFCPATSESKIKLKSKKKFFLKAEFIAAVVSGIIILGAIGIYAYKKFPISANSQTTEQRIIAYVDGIELNKDTLVHYQKLLLKASKPAMKTSKFKLKTWWNNNTNEDNFVKEEISKSKDLTQLIQKLSKSIDRAKAKRNNINNLDFDSLKTLRYSNAQQKFKNSFLKLDSSKYEVIKKNIGDVSVLNLDQIADSIKVILSPSTTGTEGKNVQQDAIKDHEVTTNTPTDPIAQARNSNSTGQKDVVKPVEKNTKSTINKTNGIIEYIRGNELKKEKLQGYLNDAQGNSALTKSINLCLNLWNLGKNDFTYCKMSESCNNDDNLKSSELSRILQEICDKDIRNYSLGKGDNIINKLNAKLQ